MSPPALREARGASRLARDAGASRPESGAAAAVLSRYGVQGAVTTQLTSSAHRFVASKTLEPPSLAM